MRFPGSRLGRGLALTVAAVGLLAGAAAATGHLPWSGADAGPVNDVFVKAEAVAGHRLVGSTAGATTDADELAAGVGSGGQAVVWYVWTAPSTGWAHIGPSQAGGSAPGIRVFVGDAIDALERVDQPSSSGPDSGTSIPAQLDTSYKIAVIGGGGAFDVTISQPSAERQLNDEPAGALDIGNAVELAASTGAPQTILVDSLDGATVSPGDPAIGGAAAERSVWFRWTPPADGGTATVSVAPAAGSTGSYRVEVFEAVLTDEAPELTGARLRPSPDASGGSIRATAGTTYFIGVDGSDGFFRATVTASGVASAIDEAPPVVECDPAPTAWSTAEVIEIACTARDDGAGLALPEDAAFTLGAATTGNAELDDLATTSRPVCDGAGNCTDAGPVTGLRSDRRAPSVACGEVDPAWVGEAASVVCTSVDEGSGLVDPADATRTFSVPLVPDTESEIEIPGGDICDQAGNCTTVGPFGPVRVDNRAPVVTCASAPAGPSRVEVEIVCTAVDGGSGLANESLSELTLTTSVGQGSADPAASTDSREVCDLVGNCTTAGPISGLDVDLAAPSVSCTPDDARPVDEWRNAPFGFTCSISDVGSGLDGAPASLPVTASIEDGQASSEVTATPAISQACDRAGNCTPLDPITGLRIDRQPPVVTCPAPGGWRSSPAVVSCTVDDGAGSGVAGAGTVDLTATVAAGEQATVDTDALQVCDRAGNCAWAGPVTGLRVDARPPTIVCDRPASRYRVEARVTCRAVDDGSGLADAGDAEFRLVTSVGDGKADPSARTDGRTVCDAVGNCAAAGPLTVSVDRTGPPGTGPALALPDRLTVLSAFEPAGPTPVPYDLPVVRDAMDVQCRARPGATFGLGWSTVVCEALGPSGTTLGSFPLVVKSTPQLGSTAAATVGGAWRAVGVGFAPGSPVQVRVGFRPVATGTAGADGRVAVPFTIPVDLPSGDHLLVLVGTDAGGDPLLVVGPLGAVKAPPNVTPPVEVPDDAPALPTDPTDPVDPTDPTDPRDPSDPSDPSDPTDPVGPTDPWVPPDPGPPPPAPDLGAGPGGPPTTASPRAPADRGTGGGRSPGWGAPFPRTGADVIAWVAAGSTLVAAGVLLRRRGRRGTTPR